MYKTQSMSIKKLSGFFLLVLLLFGNSRISSQTPDLPQKKYLKGHSLYEIISRQKESDGFSISYGPHTTSFLNGTFANNNGNSTIERRYGGIFTTSYRLYPIIIDVDWFSSNFRVKNSPTWPFSDSTVVRHRGISVFISTTFFPLVHSRTFFPYAGVGYQTSSLGVGIAAVKINENTAKDKISSIDTSAPLWKLGCSIYIFKAYKITAEYRQSLALGQKKSFSELCLLLGLDFKKL